MTDTSHAAGSHRRTRPNWAKGFFRIWIVLSIVYASAALCLQDYGKISNIWTPKNPKFDFESPSGEKYLADTSKESKVIYAEITDFLKNEVQRLQQKGNLPAADKIRNDLIHQSDDLFNTVNTQTILIRNQNKQDGYAALITTVCAVTVPPLILLLIGLLFRWIIRGFSTQSVSP